MEAPRAAQLSEQFHEKSRDAQHHSVRRFIRRQGLVFCLGNESQRSTGEVAAEALDYMQNVARPKVSQEGGRHNDFILNMDQTPIPFTYKNARKTLERFHLLTMHGKPLNLWEGAQSTCASQQATPSVPHLP